MEPFDSRTAARIVGISLRQIQYWDERGFICPSVSAAAGRGSRRLYSFSDLIKLKVVKHLSEHGLSLQKIRRCVDHLARNSSHAVRPHHSLKYLTDGDKLFVLTRDRSKILDVVQRRFVFSLGIGHLVRELSGEVRRASKRQVHGALRARRRREKNGTPAGRPL